MNPEKEQALQLLRQVQKKMDDIDQQKAHIEDLQTQYLAEKAKFVEQTVKEVFNNTQY